MDHSLSLQSVQLETSLDEVSSWDNFIDLIIMFFLQIGFFKTFRTSWSIMFCFFFCLYIHFFFYFFWLYVCIYLFDCVVVYYFFWFSFYVHSILFSIVLYYSNTFEELDSLCFFVCIGRKWNAIVVLCPPVYSNHMSL